MKNLIRVFVALSLLLVSCEKDIDQPSATLEIDAPAEIVFNEDGTGGMEAITVTTNQPEWNYTMTNEADWSGWLAVEKEGDKLKLTVVESAVAVVPAAIKITFTAGDAPERSTTAKLTPVTMPTQWREGDLWPSKYNAEGIVFWIDPASSEDGGVTGTTGWVMSLRQAPELAWSSNRTETDMGTNSDIDGRLNWSAIWAFEAANPEYAGSFEIFEWCRENYGEPWYIPSTQEMRRFFAAYAGLTPEQTEAYMIGRRLSALSSELWMATEEHRREYDMYLIEVGADPLWYWGTTDNQTSPQLWTSTKYDVDIPAIEIKPWYVGFLGEWGASSTQGQHDTHLTRAMRRFGAETVVDQLSIDQDKFTFSANDTRVETVNVTKTAATYDATVSAPWVHVVKSADSFTVSVDEYSEEDAVLVDRADRLAWVTVVSGNAPSVTLAITQVAPVTATYDLAGTWNWTGDIWDTARTLTPMSGTVTAEYNEELGAYIFSYFFENLGMTGLLDPADRVDGSIALRVNEYNNAEFVSYAELDRVFTSWIGTREYRNYVTFFAEDFANLFLSGLPADTVVEIDIINEGNTIVFPATGLYENVDMSYGFGFGYMDLDPETLEPAPYATYSPSGVYANLILTRVVE